VSKEDHGQTNRPLRVLLVHRYFWPDSPPYAVLLRAIAAHWAANGHNVQVLSSQPSYTAHTSSRPAARVEQVDGFTVRRLRMRPDRGGFLRRHRNMLRFSLLVALRILIGPRRDVVMCSTVPQVLLGWATSWAAARRRTAFIYHCMDLHPEIGRLSGEFSHPLVYRALMRLDLAACRRAAAIVVLSEDMREALLLRDRGLADRIVVLNNFDLPDYGVGDGESTVSREDDVVTVVFTGNLGRFQGLDLITAAVLSDAPAMARLRLVLMGDGTALETITDQVARAPIEHRDRVVLLPHGSVGRARALMRIADWGLVSLAPEVVRYAYPSKTATYLSEGLPVLAAVEGDSALARDVEAWGVGVHLPLTSPDAVRAALARLVEQDVGTRTAMREQAREVWRREFAAERALTRWDELLDGIGVAAAEAGAGR